MLQSLLDNAILVAFLLILTVSLVFAIIAYTVLYITVVGAKYFKPIAFLLLAPFLLLIIQRDYEKEHNSCSSGCI